MSHEIELKFEINDSDIPSLSQFLDQWVHSDAMEFELLGIGGVNRITTQKAKPKNRQQLTLINTYYDTPHYDLRKQDCGLRVRSTLTLDETHFEITVKRSGTGGAGLHERREFNASLPNAEPNLQVLPKNALPQFDNTAQLQQNLIPLFCTNFERKTWAISFANSEIEVALDQGEIKHKNRVCQIQEIELELKQGSKLDLIHFAIEFCRFHLHLFSQTKAARGYRLLQKKALRVIDMESRNPMSLAALLQCWQQNEEYALEAGDVACFQRTAQYVATALKKHQALFANELSLWCHHITQMTSISDFAYSEINTKLKLMVMLAINKNS